MQASERLHFSKLLVDVSNLYGKPLQNILMNLYWDALKEFELDSIQNALQAHINDPDAGQYMPKPADVVRHILGSGEARALNAWSKVAKAIMLVGAYSSVVFDDALIHSIITDMGGWIALCHTSSDTLPFRAKAFEKLYLAYLAHPPNRYPSQLIGIIEHQQHQYNQPITPPELVGDREKALTVLKNGVPTSHHDILLPV